MKAGAIIPVDLSGARRAMVRSVSPTWIMQNIPTSKVAQAVSIIRKAIADGEWTEYLPGERTLARDLMISRACLRQALEALTQDGVLAPVERSKRRTIARRPGKKSLNKIKKVVFFTPEPAHKAASLVLEQIAQLRYHLSKANMTVELLSSPVFKQSQASDATMQQLLREHPQAHWILHQCPEHIQKWFANQPIRATVFGSPFPSVSLPNIDIDFQSASRHATGQLLAKGHKRIAMIRFRSHLAGDDLAINGMYEAIQSHQGEVLPEPVILSHNFHVERLTVGLDKLYSSPHPPTGLIVLNHHHFVTTFSHLMFRGIRIPLDVSIISLSHDAVLERLSPTPMTYSVGDRLIRDLAQMIMNPTTSGAAKSSLLIPEAVPGKTLAAPR